MRPAGGFVKAMEPALGLLDLLWCNLRGLDCVSLSHSANPTTVDSLLELMDYAIGIALALIVSGWAARGKELWQTAN